MKRAIQEARRGVGRTAPNPPVGAVLVRDGAELGAGWHRRAGQPHAEREAIADARQRHGIEALKGATAYVTLEPCSTHGRTPPCTDGLIEAGLSRVVYGSVDPHADHSGAADAVLRSHGIEVISGVLATESDRLIRPFSKVQSTGLPWVIFKTAMSLDGRITRPPGEGMWLTGPASRARVQQIRAEVDGIVTSGETVRRDRPRLDLRDTVLLEGREMPWRVVLTNQPDALPSDAPLFVDANKHRTLVRSRVNLREVLEGLVRDQGICAVLLECGGRLAGEFLDQGLIDEVVAFMAPMVCGGPVPALGGKGWEQGVPVEEVRFERFGDDVMMRGVVRR